jgi:large subunit ribosomal protein L13
MYEKKPEEILRRAVAGMLPKNTLRRERLKLLRIFAGPQVTSQSESCMLDARLVC